MLIELRIRDYAVIDDVSVELAPGLNVISGETGAGKSIVVDALSLLLGERASSEVVRSGATRAVVEGVFEVARNGAVLQRLDDLGFGVEDGLLILRREVAAEGRNRAWVNGSPATASVVGELGRALVDLHGQHEHQSLLRPAEQRAILDAFAGNDARVARVRQIHEALGHLMSERAQREARMRELESKADFVRFQLDEIRRAHIMPGEEEGLKEEARRLEHAGELMENAERAADALYQRDGSVSELLAEMRALLERVAAIDPTLADAVASLDEAYHATVEVGRRMAAYGSSVEHHPARLEEIHRRQDLLFRLKRKYGPGLSDVMETGKRLALELEELESASMDLSRLDESIRELRARLTEEAGALTEERGHAATRLAEVVADLLPELGMPEGTFEVALEPQAEIGASGAESVEFRVSLNPGFAPRPLSRIASGGELSRVMLALKATLAAVDDVPTLVFDEIDAGVGGVVASQVAEKLRSVAGRHQVFVVTHLPQIASRAHHHLLVEKLQRAGMSMTTVAHLSGEERVRELARMLGGDPESPTSRDHARELLRSA